MNHFDQAAKSWDNNPVVWERADAIKQHMLKRLTLNRNLTAMEFGAGTGILSFMLKDSLKKILLMDNSSEMVKVMEEKINLSGVTNLKPISFDLVVNDYNATFDLIFSQMVLHHVEDINGIITKFYRMLNPGGQIAIADLYKEDGSFHDWMFNGHLGFDIEELGKIIESVGFKSISHEECYVINKTSKDNIQRKYPVFLITATK